MTRWQTSESRSAAVAFTDDDGVPLTGLSPTGTAWHKDGTAGPPTVTVTEVGGGFYRVDLSAAPARDVLLRVDGGAAVGSGRYVFGEIPVGGYVDNLDAAVSAVSAAIVAVQSDTDALQTDTASLLARLTAARALLLDELDPALADPIARTSDVGLNRGQVDIV